MKKIFITILLATLVLFINAQVTANDEVRKLINQSFSYFPAVKEAENTVVTAEQRLDLSQTNLPVVSADASYNYIKPKIEIPFQVEGETKQLQFIPVHNLSTALTGSYTVLDFGRVRANVEKAKTDLQLAKDNVTYAKSQLAYQVANIYYTIVYLKKSIIIQDSVLQYYYDNKRIIESKLRNGEAIKIDLLNVQANIDAEENRKVDLQNSLQKEINLLVYSTGTTQSAGNTFDFDLLINNSSEALTHVQINGVEYNLARDRIKQAQAETAITKLTDKPYVNVHAGAGFKNGFVPEIGEIRFNYQAGLSLNVPIYSGEKTKRQVSITETIIRQNQLAVATLNNNYQRDIDQALTDIKTNNERIQNTHGQIELAKAAQQLAASRYLNGVGTNLEITNAGANLQRAQFTRLQYEYQLCLAKIELARVAGYQYW